MSQHTNLNISPGLSLPVDAVTETFAILAVKRAGKSNAAVVMAEEMYDAAVPWVAIDPKGDWWGVRAAGNGNEKGLAVLVFGGLHGDVPLEPTAGRLVADLIVEQRITCVLDVSEMTKADQRRFLIDFADRLYRTNTEPLHVFCEEADEYIPQRVMGENAKLVGVFETLVKRGGFRGIGITLITQRSASLNKDVLTQAGTLFAMRTPSAQDRKAVAAWVDFHATSREMLAELPTLSAGEAWVFSPEWLKTVEKITFRRRRTYDSGATPKVGETRRTPTNLADVDLAAIKEAMAETIERAKADDPKALRAEIAALKKELARLEVERPEPVEIRVDVPALTPEQVQAVVGLYTRMGELAEELASDGQEWLSAVRAARREDRQDLPRARTASDSPRPLERTRTQERPDPAPRRQPSRPAVQGSAAPADLGKGERTILTAVAQYPAGVTREQLTVLTGYKRSSRDTYLQRLKQAGHVEARGTQLLATDQALDALGDDYQPLPTGAALREHWLYTLPGGEGRILQHLIDAYPSGVVRDDLTEMTGYKRSSRDTYLQRLRARQLITTDGDPRAADTLFDGDR
jgi:hypothetical protein